MAPTTSIEWTLALSRDLQPIRAGDCPHGLFLAGLPKTETKIEAAFLVALLDALRARFDYVVCDTGVQWLDGDRAGRVPAQQADQVLLVAFPTWSRSRYTGTETREAVAGSWGARPASS